MTKDKIELGEGNMHLKHRSVRHALTASALSLLAYQAVTALGIVGARDASAAPTVDHYGLQIHDAARAYQGYTIYPNGFTRKIYLLDMEGNEVHTWTHPNPNLPISFNPKPLPNGNLLLRLRRPKTNHATDNKMVELDWDSNVVWQFYDSNNANMHHDQQRMKNGNTLIFVQHQLPAQTIASYEVKCDYLIEVDPAGNIKWEWHTNDHFEEFEFSNEAKNIIFEAPLYGPLEKGDIFHSNSLQELPPNKHWNVGDARFKRGNILVSQRNTKTVFIIDKASGAIVWKIGPEDGFTIGQHDAQMIPYGLKGAGNIMIYDNGGQAGYPTETRFYTRVIEVDPITKEIVWQYNAKFSERLKGDFFSRFQGNAQRLPNGNTLINEPYWGRIFEVTRDGEIVWEYLTPHIRTSGAKNKLYDRLIARAYRVGLDWPTGPLD
jgi:hypothetical protein